MKPVKIIAALVLVAVAGFAAYYSYTIAFAPPPMHSAAGGPPRGISMPKMGGPPSGARNAPPDSRKAPDSKNTLAGGT